MRYRVLYASLGRKLLNLDMAGNGAPNGDGFAGRRSEGAEG